MQLSKNFSLAELIRSNTAVTLGLDNSPPKSVIDNLKTLCERILQPLRDFFGVPITISSGYRCAALNKAVGGSSSSQHMTGEAADIQIPKTVVKWDDG